MSCTLSMLFRRPSLSVKTWRYRLLSWGGAVSVALAAILFARVRLLGRQLFFALL